MKYIKPSYENETLETSDIILASSAIALIGGATLKETSQDTAQVGASAFDVLGINR